MSALIKAQKVFSRLKLIGNFIERPLKTGDIVLNDKGQHLIWGNIEDVIDGFSLKGKTAVSSTSDLKFTSESNVEITFGGSAGTPVASGEALLKFNSRNSAFVSLKQIQRESVKLGLIDDHLKQYWKMKGFDKPGNRNNYHFIAEVISAESGVVIFSQDRNNSVVLKGKNDLPLTSIGIIGSGRVEYVSNSKSTLEIISETPFQPLYVAVRYLANGRFSMVR
jgi:hypothetical protein